MKLIKNFVKEVKNHEIILGILMILYLFSGVETPHVIAPYIASVFGYGVLMVLAVIILVNTNPYLGVLVAISFATLAYRSNDAHPTNVMPSDNYKNTVMKSLNIGNESVVSKNTGMSFGSSKPLEEEVVEKVEVISSNNTLGQSSYDSVYDDVHGALDLTSPEN
jgi:hypothetical protein